MRNQKGFTLIELIIAIAIFGMVIGLMINTYGPFRGNQTIALPPGQTLDQITSIHPLSYTTRARTDGEPANRKEFREPGTIWDTIVVFQER